MLFLLLLYTLSQRSTAAQTLDPRASVDSCDDINNWRRQFDIIWGCLTTIFACTWVSVHPNVPPPDQSWLAHLWRRLQMMFMAVIAPELMVGFAARQLFVARRFSKEFDLTFTHGFFFSMGGFVSQIGHPITTFKQLEDPLLGPEYLSAIRKVKVAYITARSKGDALSKGVALMQGLWFITQYIARIHQHLPVTELEVATLAFAVVNVFIWLIWWKKPLDVEQPIPIGPVEEPSDPGSAPLLVYPNWLDRLAGALTGNYSKPGYNPVASTSIPSFWSVEWESTADNHNVALIIESFVGTIFGTIHCAAWNADFPSTDEMWMWRTCSLMVTATPMLVAATTIFFKPRENFIIDDIILVAIFLATVPTYPIARLFLIILPFTALRALPPGVFMDVNWSVYIPHL
ncbi:hypothetical protein DFH09DRAFT_1079211 [Mycena vulgaris]|nr:hypothetical protein DFH09DRAFT_1079211 [Mycena vulgaris]